MGEDSTGVAPVPGEIVDTVYGRQRVTAVIDMPLIEPTIYLRPEHGGQEWSVPVAQFARVRTDHSDTP
ncbi:hypothetical protein [Streptodolium elevatio]|uniref:Uncharacterized protein n=1 Tax=Streptodolium elevatio TaxID=3157996 RepID=A0ABV3DMN6_9ACTN